MTKRVASSSLAAFFVAMATLALVQRESVEEAELARIVEVLDVDPGEVVADVGAGNGRFSVELARIVGDEGHVYATEVDPKDLEEIRERIDREDLENVTVVRGSQEDTELPDRCCHGILLRRVYHHFQQPAAMQASLREALRDEGLLLIIDFDSRSGWDHGIGQERLVSEMEAAGFELVREMDWRGRDYGLLFKVAAVPD